LRAVTELFIFAIRWTLATIVIFTSIQRFCFPLFASIPTATFVLLGFFTGPKSDDWCYGSRLRELGYIEAIKWIYLQWQGRYAANELLQLAGYLDYLTLLTWYWVGPTTLILAIIFSSYVLLNALNRLVLESALRRSQVVVASIVLTSIYLVSLDRPSEVLYWLSASVSYQLANVLVTILLATLIHFNFAKTKAKKFFLFAASGLLVLLVVGLNEVIMAVILSFLGLSVLSLCFSQYDNRISSYKVILTCLLVIAIIGSLVVILAPGNSIRIQVEENTWGWNQANSIWELLQAGFSTTIWAVISTMRWLLTQPYHCFAIFLALVLAGSFSRGVQEYIESKWLLWVPIISFALVWVAAFTCFYLGIKPPARAIACIYVVFWLSFIPSGVVLMRYHSWELHGRGLKTILKIALVGSMLLHPHHTQAMGDFKDAVLYRLQLQERERIVSSAIQEGRRDVVVPRLMRVPATFYLPDLDLSEDKSSYYNKCYTLYRGLDSIVARGEGDTSRLIRELKGTIRSQMDWIVRWR
jgi:hypothetical protein